MQINGVDSELRWCFFCNELVNFSGLNPIKYIILDAETSYGIH